MGQSNFKTLELAKSFYQECAKLKLKGPMKNQFERASLSIVLNLAEGSGKLSARDRRHFYSISYGSLKETLVMIELGQLSELYKKGDILGAYLWKLMQNPGGS